MNKYDPRKKKKIQATDYIIIKSLNISQRIQKDEDFTCAKGKTSFQLIQNHIH